MLLRVIFSKFHASALRIDVCVLNTHDTHGQRLIAVGNRVVKTLQQHIGLRPDSVRFNVFRIDRERLIHQSQSSLVVMPSEFESRLADIGAQIPAVLFQHGVVGFFCTLQISAALFFEDSTKTGGSPSRYANSYEDEEQNYGEDQRFCVIQIRDIYHYPNSILTARRPCGRLRERSRYSDIRP